VDDLGGLMIFVRSDVAGRALGTGDAVEVRSRRAVRYAGSACGRATINSGRTY